jgi:PPE-repeat protein
LLKCPPPFSEHVGRLEEVSVPTDFGIYPPEINSLRMYTGPGPGPMLAAMQAWENVADELYTTAGGYQSVVSELAQAAWLGPSSEAMKAAAKTQVQWLSATAAQAEQTALQARMAAAAYEAAFASTVPPPEVAANRSLLTVLVATNFLGQNTPAIAATEALYAEMWAQDALAMYSYAGSSAAAVVLSPFSSPHPNTDSGATASQAAAISRIAGSVAGDAQNVISVVPQALSVLAAPAAGEELSPLASLIAIFINSPGDLAAIFVLTPTDVLTGFAEVPPAAFTTLSGLDDDDTFSHYNGKKPWPDSGPAAVEPFPANLPNPPAGVLPASTTAALGEANLVGELSVPPGWTMTAPEVRAIAFSTPLTAIPPAGAALLEGGAPMFGQGMLGQAMIGQAMAGAPPPGAEKNAKPATHARRSGNTAAAPPDDCVKAPPAPRKVVTGVVAAIRDVARQRAEGLLTEQEYNERKKVLLESSLGHPTLT